MSSEKYSETLGLMPILCVDLALRAPGGYILVKRLRAPAKGRWWVPGGRVLRGESVSEAARRKAKEELGLEIEIQGALGFYEHFYKMGHKAGSHTVSVVVQARPRGLGVRLDSQSSAWKISPHLPDDFKMTRFGR